MSLSNTQIFRMTGVDRTQFNPVADAWGDLPPTTGGKARSFEEHHVISLFAFRGFINLGFSLRNAAVLAAKISDELKQHGDDVEAVAVGVPINAARAQSYTIYKRRSQGSEEFGTKGIVVMLRMDFDPIRDVIRKQDQFVPEDM